MHTTETRSRALTEDEAAKYLGLSRATLAASRLRARRCAGPAYLKIGRAVRYDVRDLDLFIDAHRIGARDSAGDSGGGR